MSPEDAGATLFIALLVSVVINLVLSVKLTYRTDDHDATKRFLTSTTRARDRAEQRLSRLLEGLEILLKRDKEDN